MEFVRDGVATQNTSRRKRLQMKKLKTSVYRYSSCGKEEPKWLGRCPECGMEYINRDCRQNESRQVSKNGLP